jgi:hypothetical protein
MEKQTKGMVVDILCIEVLPQWLCILQCVLQHEWRKYAWKIIETCKISKSIENCKVWKSAKTWTRALRVRSFRKVEGSTEGVSKTS